MQHRITGAKKILTLSVVGVALLISATGLTSGCSQDKDRAGSDAGIQPIHTVNFSGAGVDLAADGNLLAVSARNKGIYVYDVTTPERPLEIAALELPYVYRTVVQNKTIFGFDEQEGLSFIDLANINRLTLTQSLSTAELYGYVNDAAWTNDTLFFASESIGLSAYAVSAEFSLTGGKIGTAADQPATSIAIVQNRLIAASFRGEINVYERSPSPEHKLTAVNGLITGHRISSLACNEFNCYTAALSEGLMVYGYAEAAKPERQYQLNFGDVIDLVHIDEELLYAGFRGPKGKNGWYVFSLKDSTRPAMVHKITTGIQIRDFMRIGNIAYVLLADGQLQLYERGSLQ